MDDLAGLSWSSSPANQGSKPPPTGNPLSSFHQTLRPTPSPLGSGRNTPLSVQNSGSIAPKAQTSKPAGDAFSNLVNFGAPKSTANLSMREQQQRLVEEKRRKEEEKKRQMEAQFGNGQFWDTLSQKPSANASRTASPAFPVQASSAKETDSDTELFAAFRAETKVDTSSFYPPPSGSQPASGKGTPAAPLDLGNPSAWSNPAASNGGFDDDDDPFDLNQLQAKTSTAAPVPAAAADDDDLLGDLGRPVEEVRRMQAAKQTSKQTASAPEPGKPIEDSDSDSDDGMNANLDDLDDPFEKAVSQLVELGFTPENARRGLTESGNGLNVQAAVSYLLDDAERQARQKAKAKARGGQPELSRGERNRPSGSAHWMKDEGPRDSQHGGDPDLSKTAATVGASFLKSANSLWKTGQKKMQQAVADFQQDSDPSQPKWMRSAQQDVAGSQSQKRPANMTDEALMLEGGMRPERISAKATHHSARADSSRTSSRDHSPALPPSARGPPVPRWQQGSPAPPLDPKARFTQQLSADDQPQAYVSPARRKKASPQPQPSQQPKAPVPEPDLLNTNALPSRLKATPQRSAQASPIISRPPTQPSSRTITPRPAAPPRQIPSVSPVALQTSHKHRVEGTTHFKRGDYAAAHASYTTSLSAIPQTHPLTIVLLTNRALTALKTGEPKQAIADADSAIKIIGPSQGVGESVSLDNGENRDMKELYGKALSRKAEALEQLEKWADAGTVWQLCVEAGVGGQTAIAGKQRCQKAFMPKPVATPATSRTTTPRPAAKPKPSSAMADLAPAKNSEAVERLRAANKAAAAEDDEKFALSEKVDARISAWRDGKRDNLRALLGSLDNVLWESSGWKKVGMHELVMANRVKIVYMKAIAKCHPDKLPQDASTEVRLIAGTVFSTLNESWDKFKAENNL